ncbi:unnamed protein product [marine sediment metagenome]|uniref:Uncharacterized protein n=1 Tax=marine sediment metagenome TaxID=412755 RepID=X0THJ2_9ZZZZ
MKLWSRGLGKQELKMDFMRYDIKREGQEIVISGRITDPVNWDFWIRFDEDDVPGLVRVAKNPNVIRLVFGHWFKKIFPFRRQRVVEEAVEEPVASAPESGGGASESE